MEERSKQRDRKKQRKAEDTHTHTDKKPTAKITAHVAIRTYTHS